MQETPGGATGASLLAVLQPAAEAVGDRIVEISRFIHAHPETRFVEHTSSAFLTEALAAAGFAVQQSVADLPTAFVAELPTAGNGPVVALMAEYDALPGLGHACGHNLIAAMSVGAALILQRVWPQLGLRGHLRVIGTPGEEGGGGKIFLLERGVFDGVAAAAMLHPGGHNNPAPVMLARDGVDVRFAGRAAHAASAPDRGVDALNAAVAFQTLVNAMRPTLRRDANIYGIMTAGGQSPNIIVEEATLRMQIRAADGEYLEELVNRMRRGAEGVAAALGATVSWQPFVPRYQALKTDPALAELLTEAFTAVGRPVEAAPRPGGSTDAGNVSQRIPTVHGTIRLGSMPGHSVEFAEAAGSPAGEQVAREGALVLAYLVVRILQKAGGF